ncbi:MAG TPA: HAMP domain-containing sensor histidine kinase, partial [Ktedonobacterales bacterium]|nr:HAMP domain-containing sensor histidine kinase [Ktedonobacterales bacterium]
HVNHELRSPVMALQGHVELLLLTEEKLTATERHTYLVRAKRAGDDLVSLVTSILSVRRLEQDADASTPQAVVIREALESAVRLIDPRDGQFIERELRVHMPEGQSVWADPVRVRQILTNLLTNAIKYSPAGTPVEVTADLISIQPTSTNRRQQQRLPPSRQMVDIAVRDHGLGIPSDQIPLLFTRFVRLPRDLASNVPGNGLGLYLCRAFAEAMGGTISVESTGIEGEGSTFHLRLPLSSPAEDSAIASGYTPASLDAEPARMTT